MIFLLLLSQSCVTEITKDVEFTIESASSLQAGRLIYAERVDAYIGDFTGYYYALQMQHGKQEADRLSDIKYYFNSNPQRICFKDKAIRDRFDETLSELISEKVYQQVYDKHSLGFSAHFFGTTEGNAL